VPYITECRFRGVSRANAAIQDTIDRARAIDLKRQIALMTGTQPAPVERRQRVATKAVHRLVDR